MANRADAGHEASKPWPDHAVYTPTQTGCGERSHLLSRSIALDTFVDDIANVLQWEDLHRVALVGHSFGGIAITGVADCMPERLRQLVSLDAGSVTRSRRSSCRRG